MHYDDLLMVDLFPELIIRIYGPAALDDLRAGHGAALLRCGRRGCRSVTIALPRCAARRGKALQRRGATHSAAAAISGDNTQSSRPACTDQPHS